eukprot:scaffold5715_cov166-Amphora_coffeaeformis.AAC.2
MWKLLAGSIPILTLLLTLRDAANFPTSSSRRSKASFTLAYLTNWGMTFVTLYFVMSIWNTASALRDPCLSKSNNIVRWRIRITWFLFALATHTILAATILFWPIVYDPQIFPLDFITFSAHGLLFVLTTIDGIWVNHIPLRFQMWYGVLVVDMAYVGWTIIHSFATDIGNPATPESDAIYPDILDWK